MNTPLRDLIDDAVESMPPAAGKETKINKMKFIVSQTFDTLGDPCEETFHSREAADVAAGKLSEIIAVMVSDWETPEHDDSQKTGFIGEIDAWTQAEELAGVEFDDAGDRTPESPKTYGIIAGRHIASKAVSIETSDEE